MLDAKLDGARACPLCGGGAKALDFPYATIWQGRMFRYLRCGSCSSVYVDPVPSEKELAALYSQESYHDVHYQDLAIEPRHSRAVSLLRRYAGHRTRLLDFGCGNGTFLRAAANAGFEVCGVEFHPSVIEWVASGTGLRVTGFDEVQKSGERFDIIHLGDVFEHLTSPMETLGALRAVLAPSGLLFVEGPLEANPSLVRFCAKGIKLARHALGKSLIGSHAPTHLMMVTRRAQEEFFTTRFGLRKVHFEVYEDGWPYRVAHSLPATPGVLFKRGVALAAVAASRLRVGGRQLLGNRFAGIFEA